MPPSSANEYSNNKNNCGPNYLSATQNKRNQISDYIAMHLHQKLNPIEAILINKINEALQKIHSHALQNPSIRIIGETLFW
jgi:hypothetical protein